MRLYIDIGNSLTKLVVDDNGFGKPDSIITNPESFQEAFFSYAENLEKPEQVIVSNVAGKKCAEIISHVCEKAWAIDPYFLEVSSEFAGVQNGYKAFKQLGIDRWAAIIAAWNKHRGNVFVVDCGSAVTLDLVLHSGEHLGGYIIPGNRLMIQALTNNTSDIANIFVDAYSETPGKSTAECIANATIDAVHYFIEYKYTFSNQESDIPFQCIITGGGAESILGHLSIPYQYDPLLVFEGMKIINGSCT